MTRWVHLIREAGVEGALTEAELDEALTVSADWGAGQIDQALRALDILVTLGHVAPMYARLIQSGLRMSLSAIVSGARVARVPDVIGVAYVEAAHVQDAAHSADDLRERMTDPYRLGEVDRVAADHALAPPE